MPKFAMISMVAVAALIGAAVATPHPECEPCAAVKGQDLEALANNGKYLCCDLTCLTTPVVGCGVFGLPLVCKACYDGDGTPEFDAPPEGDTTPSTPSPVTPAPVTPSTRAPVTPSTRAPVTPSTPAPVTPASPGTPAPVTVETTPATPSPVENKGTPAPVEVRCTACDAADEVLSKEDLLEIEDKGLELVCDQECNANLEGCGAFGLELECRAVDIPDDDLSGSGTGTGEGEGGGGGGEGSGSGSGSGSSDGGGGGGEGSGSGSGSGSSDGGGGGSGSGSGSGSSSVDDASGEDSGDGSSDGGASCTAEEEALCADISEAQREALAMYDSGGKIIICDPTCVDGVTDPTHCNYFGINQRCRGCGACSDCTPCP